MMPDEIGSGLQVPEPLVFERSREGKVGAKPPTFFSGQFHGHRSAALDFPSVSELDVVRHFTRLSQRNFSIDLGMYPLGSCTMKYNPRINETIASWGAWTDLHPYLPTTVCQGALSIIGDLEHQLTEITGMAATTLMPAAGAQGELTGLRLVSAYLRDHNKNKRVVLIPDTAHGTNPASCVAAGFEPKPLKAGKMGVLRAEDVAAVMDDRVAALMMTNPNTLGLFETDVNAIGDLLHESGAFLVGDGANLNAMVGVFKFGELGFDVVQLNLHKTFSTPHGGGGPGCGPVSVCERLVPYLPKPRVVWDGASYQMDDDLPKSIGRVKPFWGQFLVMVRAWGYISLLGADGLRQCAQDAVLAARYIQSRLKDCFDGPREPCMHEVVFSDSVFKNLGIKTIDIAKALMDFGFHPPTVYFPLVISGALLIEPTECESKQDLDRFCDTLRFLVHQAKENPSFFEARPHKTPVGRVNEALAARNLDIAQ